jgi:hypothetical protein
MELEKIGDHSDHLCNKIGLDVALEALRESWCDRVCFFLKCDRPASRGAFAKAIALFYGQAIVHSKM